MDERRLRILLVDDDEDDFVMTRDLLSEIEAVRFELDWAGTYDGGREAIRRAQHDVYLLDYRLGQYTGLELLKEAVEDGCRAPIILLTGQGDHELDMEAMRAGAADYLVKGEFGSSLLERAIRYAVEKNRMMVELEEARLCEEQRFRELDQLKSDLIAFVSHELRTPLTSVKGYAQTLLASDADELRQSAEEFLSGIISESERLLRLVNGFLDISAIDSGHGVELVRETFDAGEMAEEALRIARANATRCSFETRREDDPATLFADRDKVLQVLINLLSNADKYSPNGGVVRVRLTRADGSLRFEVSDRGMGISAEAAKDLFTPFYRVRSTGQSTIDGAGLGLYLCRQLVEAHGGQIGVESQEGEGSAFWFTIPECEA